MEDDTIHVDQNFLEPSADLEALVGTLLVAINDQLLADESHAEWSMAAWQRWLDDEGYPIHEAIDQFYNQVASSYSTELESLKSELIERLHEPHGLELLDRIIDSQRPEIAENLHDFIDQAVSKANESYQVAGGTHTKAIVGGTVGLLCFTIGIGLKIRNNNIKRALTEKANSLQTDAERAFQKRIDHIHGYVDAQLDLHLEYAKKANDTKKLEQVNTIRKDQNMQITVDRSLIGDKKINNVHAGQIEISLKQDVRSLSEKEVQFMKRNYAKSLANKSLELMKRSDLIAYDQLSKDFKEHYRVQLFKERRYDLTDVYENHEFLTNDAAPRKLKTMVVRHTSFPVKATEFIRLEDLKDLDEQAKIMADARIHKWFDSELDTMTQKAFNDAYSAVGDEAAKIKVSFKDAYDRAKEYMKKDLIKLDKGLANEDRAIRDVLKNEIAKADQRIANEASEAEGDFKITIE